jgi:hypothetical protein
MQKSKSNKLPEGQKKLPEVKIEGCVMERKQMNEMNKNLGFLIQLVTSVKEELFVLSNKVKLNSESITDIQSLLNNAESNNDPEGSSSGKLPMTGLLTIKPSSTPVSALTDEGYADSMWRETELTKKLQRRFTDPELMESIATQTGANFLMLIRFSPQ